MHFLQIHVFTIFPFPPGGPRSPESSPGSYRRPECSQGGPRIQRYQVFSEEPQTWFAPNISKSFYRRSSHVALNQEETHLHAPQSINKSFYRRSSHVSPKSCRCSSPRSGRARTTDIHEAHTRCEKSKPSETILCNAAKSQNRAIPCNARNLVIMSLTPGGAF